MPATLPVLCLLRERGFPARPLACAWLYRHETGGKRSRHNHDRKTVLVARVGSGQVLLSVQGMQLQSLTFSRGKTAIHPRSHIEETRILFFNSHSLSSVVSLVSL